MQEEGWWLDVADGPGLVVVDDALPFIRTFNQSVKSRGPSLATRSLTLHRRLF